MAATLHEVLDGLGAWQFGLNRWDDGIAVACRKNAIVVVSEGERPVYALLILTDAPRSCAGSWRQSPPSEPSSSREVILARTMHDSVTARDIPSDAEMVAGYIDGKYAWSAADWARFPHAAKVRIAVRASTNDGDVLDVEPGDATPAQAAGWIRMRQAAGYFRPTIYTLFSWVDQVHVACKGLDYDLWVAHYTGKPHNEAGAVATQYADPATSGGHFDLSLVVDDGWPHRTAPHPPNPPHPPEEDDDMAKLLHPTEGPDAGTQFVWSGGTIGAIDSNEVAIQLQKHGLIGQAQDITTLEWEWLQKHFTVSR